MVFFRQTPSYTEVAGTRSTWGGFPVVRGLRVFVKPNFVTPPTGPDTASCTRVEVLEEVLRALRDGGAGEIRVGDCGFKNQWETTMRAGDYLRLEGRYGVKVIPLQDGENFHRFTLLRCEPGYRSLFGARISDWVLECDMIIDVPKLKVHSMALVTCSIKNLMGIMAQKGSMHPRGSIDILHERLHDLYHLLRSRVGYIVVDGVMGSEFAEQSGVPFPHGVTFGGTDLWEVDCAAAMLMGISPRDVPYLRYIAQSRQSRGELLPRPAIPPELIRQYERPLAWR